MTTDHHPLDSSKATSEKGKSSSDPAQPANQTPAFDNRRSIKVAWAITVGEAILLAGCVWVFVDYWMMLPVRLRVAGILGLTGVTALCVYRMVRFYKRSNRT